MGCPPLSSAKAPKANCHLMTHNIEQNFTLSQYCCAFYQYSEAVPAILIELIFTNYLHYINTLPSL